MTQSQLLEIRKELKSRKPVFIRQDNPKRPKLSDKWRKPKGIHSKIRHHFKGRRKMPSPGYKSPLQVKGLHSTGLKMIKVFSLQDLNRIKKDSEGIVISKNVGTRKRLEILKRAKEINAMVLNMNIDSSIKKIEDFINSKKKKESKEPKKETAKEEKKPEDVKETKEMTDEQKKEAEKKEKDKVLTKKM